MGQWLGLQGNGTSNSTKKMECRSGPLYTSTTMNVLEARRLLGLQHKTALWHQRWEDIWLRVNVEQVSSRASAPPEVCGRVLGSIERHPALGRLDNLWHTDDFAMALDVVCREVARERIGF
ncbi:MAG: hypothetical protein M1816_002089 [Peltula sp. TS41687]|nr:MAG: hypothetical protein M1816_002089 [Peltula sp. TS41687]